MTLDLLVRVCFTVALVACFLAMFVPSQRVWLWKLLFAISGGAMVAVLIGIVWLL
jgi:hypothetical protein